MNQTWTATTNPCPNEDGQAIEFNCASPPHDHSPQYSIEPYSSLASFDIESERPTIP